MKLLIGLLCTAGIYTGVAYYTGSQAEQGVQEYIAKEAQRLEPFGYKLSLESYQRGVFTSKARVRLEYNKLPAEIGFVALNMNNHIQHGPLLFKGGFGIGALSVNTDFSITSASEELNQAVFQKLDHLGELVTQVYYSSNYAANYLIAAKDYLLKDDLILKVGDVTIKQTGNLKTGSGDYSGKIGRISFDEADSNFVADEMQLSGSYQMASELVMLNNYLLGAPRIEWGGSIIGSIQFENLQLKNEQKLANDLINTVSSFTVKTIKGPLQIDNLSIATTLNNISITAMEEFSLLASSFDPATLEVGEEISTTIIGQIHSLLNQFISTNSNLTFNINADLMGGKAKFDTLLDLRDAPKVLPAVGEFEVETLLGYLYSDSSILVTQNLVEETMLGMMLAGPYGDLVARDGTDYVMRARLNKGVFTVNDQEFPLNVLTDML